MKSAFWLAGAYALLCAGTVLAVDPEPVLRVEPEGPTADVTALVFSPDAKHLYAAGLDKLVHIWKWDEDTKKFVRSESSFRVPIGPGHGGVLNAMALSPDGKLLAVAGRGLTRDSAGFRTPGVVLPRNGGRDEEALKDEGAIYLFDTVAGKSAKPGVLRGHRGHVLALAFAPAKKGKPPLLVSMAQEEGEGVVRVWNPSEPKPEDQLIATLPLLRTLVPENGDPTPVRDIAVWHTGADPKDLKQLRIALALGDGTLRFWDPNSDKPNKVIGKILDAGENPYDRTAAYLNDQELLVTGYFDAAENGRVQAWLPSTLKPDQAKSFTFNHANKRWYIPRALITVPPDDKRKQDLLAVVVQVVHDTGGVEKEESYELRIIDTGGKSWQETTSVPLWKIGKDSPPVRLAATPGHLAIAGDSGNAIRVYSIAGLLNGKTQANQILQSTGVSFSEVAFVKKGKSPGIALDALVFDLTDRRLVVADQSWKPDRPDTGGWKKKLERENGAWVITIYQGGGEVGKVRLEKGQTITDKALFPPRKPLEIPLLAVAMIDRGEPKIGLYNGKTGEQFRQLTGHQASIKYLIFSGDGTKLVSTGEDQMVCVWNLEDLPKTVGKISRLRGVAIHDDKAKLVVGDAVDNELHKGDVIVGIVSKDKVLRKLKKALEFYLAIEVLPPTDKMVTLRVLRDGKELDILLALSQGIDERKPLFTLFVKQVGAEKWSWIGWDPFGKHDYSDEGMEPYLKWQFNPAPDKAEESVRLGAIKDFRDDRKPGLLPQLFGTGVIIDPPPSLPPTPEVFFQLESGEKNVTGAVPATHVLRGGGEPVTLPPRPVLLMYVKGIKAEDVEEANWHTLKGKKKGKFELKDGLWRADLATARWQRGPEEIEIAIRYFPDKADRRDDTRKLPVRYLPPPSTLHVKGADSKEPVKKPKYTLEATVVPGDAEQEVEVRVHHLVGDEEIRVTDPELVKGAGKETLKWDFQLESGTNTFKVVAKNKDASDDNESVWGTRTVIYEWVAPQLQLGLIPVDGGKDGVDIDLNKQEPGKTLTVDVPNFRLHGKIVAADELRAATIQIDKLDPEKLKGFEPGAKEPTFDHGVNLKATDSDQPHQIQIVVQTKNVKKPSSTTIMRVAYLPRLPILVLTQPDNKLWNPDKPSEIALEGKLSWPTDDPQPCTAHVFLGDKELNKIELNKDNGDFKTTVLLAAGRRQTIQVKLRSKWRPKESSADTVSFVYRRVPVLSRALKPDVKGAYATLRAEVRSPRGLPLKSVSLNGTALDEKKALEELKTDLKGTTTWLVKAENIALQPGMNLLQLEVNNGEESLKLPVEKIEAKNVDAPPSVVTSPATGGTVTTPDLDFTFNVHSNQPLLRVLLTRNGKIVLNQEFKETDRQFDYQKTEPSIHLDPGNNIFEVVANNKGGRSPPHAPVNIYYRAIPVGLAITGISLGGKMLKETDHDGQSLVFEKSDDSKVSLHGQVTWEEKNDATMKKVRSVDLYVNGRHYPDVSLVVKGPHQKEFKYQVTLDRPEGNQLTLRLPNLAQLTADAATLCEARLDCRKPATLPGRCIHLVIIGTDPKGDDKALARHVVESLGGDWKNELEFTKPGFDDGRIYGPIGKKDVDELLLPLFHRVIKALNQRADDQKDADMVIFYCQGQEQITPYDHLLYPDPRKIREGWSVSTRDVHELVNRAPGSQLLLLDVLSPNAPDANKDFVSLWPSYPHLAVVRYAWQKPKLGLLKDFETALKDPKPPTELPLKAVIDLLSDDFYDFHKGEVTGRWPSKKNGNQLLYSLRKPSSLDDMPLRLSPR